MTLDHAVNRALARARTAERALHDRRGWTMEALGRRVPCSKTLGDDRIVFQAYLPDPMPGSARVVLRCGEDVVDVADVFPVGGHYGAGPRGAWTELRHEIVVASL